MSWQSSASINMLKQRARLLQDIRTFFQQRNVWEVETPILSRFAGTDVHLDPLEVGFSGSKHYLHTSPEFAMKRLLATGSGSIFQICKVFRDDELGRQHNPEFTMLEWYRVGFDERQLMDEVSALLVYLQDRIAANSELSEAVSEETSLDGICAENIERLSYRDAFMRYLQLDPFHVSVSDLKEAAYKITDIDLDSDNRDDWLHLLLALGVEPKLGMSGATFIYDYPACQAALAQKGEDEGGNVVAKRFELYVKGVELANGYLELTDAEEQRLRFEQDLCERQALKRKELPMDEKFLAALDAGMPACAGVALGIDRLLMAQLGTRDIKSVLSFSYDKV